MYQIILPLLECKVEVMEETDLIVYVIQALVPSPIRIYCEASISFVSLDMITSAAHHEFNSPDTVHCDIHFVIAVVIEP